MLNTILLTLQTHRQTIIGGVNGGVNGDMQPILSWIESHPGCHAGAIAENCGLSLRTVQRLLRLLKQEQRIEFRGAPRNGGYFAC